MKELLDLEPNDCRHPMNDGGPYLFCAEAKDESSSYCSFHRRICLREVMEHWRGRENPHAGAAMRKNVTTTRMLISQGMSGEA